MPIPITIENLLNNNIVEWDRIEFKEGWNPDTTLKTISAFANDIDNWGGGYLVIGAKEENGRIVKPIKGLSSDSIDKIQKELLQYCKMIHPSYLPQSQPVVYEGADLLLVWCPGGYDRPYQCPKKPTSKNSEVAYYIRKFASTVEATDIDRNELMSLARNIPFDDRVNIQAKISDLKFQLIRQYLEEVDSSLLHSLDSKSLEELSSDLRIASGPVEYFKPLNVGLLFFNEKPENFFPYTRIEIVNIPDPTGDGMEERIFTGPIDQQLRDALLYIKNMVIAEKIFKVDGQAEAIRIKNYSYEALEEFISNAVYHKSYQQYDPIVIRIEKESIEIYSAPGPDRSISDKDIKNLTMRTGRYRNRRIGDFLKELHLVEGRNTGIPKALRSIKANGSPLPKFLTDEERTYFTVILPIHEAFKEKSIEIKKPQNKRKTKKQVKDNIMKQLEEEAQSISKIYRTLGYKGMPSSSFLNYIDELICEKKIEYTTDNPKAPNNKLKLKS